MPHNPATIAHAAHVLHLIDDLQSSPARCVCNPHICQSLQYRVLAMFYGEGDEGPLTPEEPAELTTPLEDEDFLQAVRQCLSYLENQAIDRKFLKVAQELAKTRKALDKLT